MGGNFSGVAVELLRRLSTEQTSKGKAPLIVPTARRERKKPPTETLKRLGLSPYRQHSRWGSVLV